MKHYGICRGILTVNLQHLVVLMINFQFDHLDLRKPNMISMHCQLISMDISRHHLSRVMRKPAMWFSNRSYTNRAVQAQVMARGWKSWIEKEEELYNPRSENKGADQLRSN